MKSIISANRILNLAQKALEVFESSEINEKRQILDYLLQNCKLSGKNFFFELEAPFDTVLQVNNSSTLLPLQNAFRTFDWKRIKQEIMDFQVLMGQKITLISV